jgi:hypothetical protein
VSTFKQRRIYFQSIAEASNLIAHGQLVEGVARRSFFRINGELELAAAVMDKADTPCMVHNDFVVIPSQPVPYVYRKTIVNEILFLSKFDAQNGLATEWEEASDLAYAAAAEFLSFMLHDFEENGRCCNLFHFDLNGAKLEMYGPVLDNWIGWRLTFTDLEKGNEFKYNADSFTDPANATEAIYFTDKSQVDITWTEVRRSNFGDFPTIEVWFNNGAGGANIAWPSIVTDVPPPDQALITVYNGSVQSGFIILK